MKNITLKNLTILEKENIELGLMGRLDTLSKLLEEKPGTRNLMRYDVLACINILKLLGYEHTAKRYQENFSELFD